MDDRVARCHLLAEIFAADGIMTDSERALLEQHFTNHELSDAEKEQIRNFEGADRAIAALRDRPELERQQILDELVEASLADGKLSPNETAAVKRIAQALGFSG